MKIHFEFTAYKSKLATFISILQSGFTGWVTIYMLIAIISFIIAKICDADSDVLGILSGVVFILSIAVSVGVHFINADNIDDFMTKKRKKSNIFKGDIEKKQRQGGSGTNIFRKKPTIISIYKETYNTMINVPVVEKCQNHRPLTAALLFIIEDLTFAIKKNDKLRKKEAKLIFSYLEEGCLSAKEFEVFDKAVELFSEIIQGSISARGDWCCNMAGEGWCWSVFACYGDLMRFPQYLQSYLFTPIVIKPSDDSLAFMVEFMELYSSVVDYTQKITDTL